VPEIAKRYRPEIEGAPRWAVTAGRRALGDLEASTPDDALPDDGNADVDEFLLERDDYEGWELFSAPSWRSDWPRFVTWFMAQVFTEADSLDTIDELVENARGSDVEMLIRQEAVQDGGGAAHLGSVTGPVLIVQGGADVTQDGRAAYDLAARMGRADVAWLDGLGHRPDIRRPDLVNPLLRDFLTSHG
jgi:pimeloyl-ACP methyl ester carboxylesterase